jgi:pimeloyl-ACP methyl ester carboxylesterase
MISQTTQTIERKISFQSGSLTLEGTFLLPGADRKYPAVLLLPGSGQVDRDENTSKLAINVMLEMANHLASQGIATFRYDKRGIGASQGDYWTTGFLDRVSDAEAALAWLKSQDQIQPDKVFLLGHSEGSGLSVRLAGSGADVAGVILLAGWARPSQDMLVWQAEQVVPGMRGINGWLIRALHINIRKAQLKQFDKIKRSKKDMYRQLYVKVNAKWLREFLSYDPAEYLKNVRVPVLAITGSKDIQVNPADLKRMAELVQGEFESHELPDLTHMLRTDSGQPTLNTYKEQLTRPVNAGLLELVSGWLKRQIDR